MKHVMGFDAGKDGSSVIILSMGDQIEGPLFTPLVWSDTDKEFLKVRQEVDEMILRLFNLYGGVSWPVLATGPEAYSPEGHAKLAPKPALDANARVVQYPVVPVDYIIPKSRDERRR